MSAFPGAGPLRRHAIPDVNRPDDGLRFPAAGGLPRGMAMPTVDRPQSGLLPVEDRLETAVDHARAVERHFALRLHALVLHDLRPGGVADLLRRPFDP